MRLLNLGLSITDPEKKKKIVQNRTDWVSCGKTILTFLV